jgi:hypothetical protein
VAGARISQEGILTVPDNGEVAMDAEYQSHHAQARARLSRDGPGQMLSTLRGRVYVETDNALRPVAQALVQVVGGTSVGFSTTTAVDGSYEFVALVPGEVAVRATKTGYTAAEGSTEIRPGDNRLSLLIEVVPPTGRSRL